MAIVGIVVRFEAHTRHEMLARLSADPRVTCGPTTADALALTLEAATADATAWLGELATWPGVVLVTPVFHDFEDELSDGLPLNDEEPWIDETS